MPDFQRMIVSNVFAHPISQPRNDRSVRGLRCTTTISSLATRVAMVEHREYDALVLSYTHLKNLPRQYDALRTLKKIASLVKPIMRARGWRVKELCEFYPDQQNLLGTTCCLQQYTCLLLTH